MKALCGVIEKLWPRLKFFWPGKKVGQIWRSRSQGQNIGIYGKVLSQGIHMWNMKALCCVIQNLWPRLKLFWPGKKEVKFRGKGHKVKIIGTDGKVSSQGIHMWNMKALCRVIKKLWHRLTFSDGLTDGCTEKTVFKWLFLLFKVCVASHINHAIYSVKALY